MVRYIVSSLLMLALLMCYTGCSSSEEAEKKTGTDAKKDSLYVFDEVPADTSARSLEITPIPSKETVSTQPVKSQSVHYVQIGAFTTQEKASEFEAMAAKKLKKELKVFFSSQKQLFVVQVMPGFPQKKDAENYRDEIWKMKEFKDAWIVSDGK